MAVSPETKLNKPSTCSYNSFADSFQSANGLSPGDVTCDWNKKHGERIQVVCNVMVYNPLCSAHRMLPDFSPISTCDNVIFVTLQIVIEENWQDLCPEVLG